MTYVYNSHDKWYGVCIQKCSKLWNMFTTAMTSEYVYKCCDINVYITMTNLMDYVDNS